MIKIAPSILAADFTRLGEEIKEVEAAGADYIHIDVMDGRFVPNISVGPVVVEAVRRCTSLPLDVHLMIYEPERYIRNFIKAGADIITIHPEATFHLHRVIYEIKNGGRRAGVALNPSSELSLVNYIVDEIDLLLIMSVNPGFGGQEFINGMLRKIRDARGMVDKKGLSVELEVDGGIKLGNAGSVARAGADILVSGTGIFGTDNYRETIKRMRDEAFSVEA